MTRARNLGEIADSSYISAVGNKVGIGSTVPQYTLDVAGDLRFTGNLYQGESIFSSGVGIQSAGIIVGSGITTLNFIGAGNTFSVNGNTVDISISGGSGTIGESYWVQTDVGIHTLSNVGIGTTNPTERLEVDGNIKLTGELYGPATFVIDPAAVGDNTGTVVIKGNLQIDGTTTTVNSTTVTVDDKNIVLASGAANASAADGGGITLDGANASITYASSGDKWVVNKGLEVDGALHDFYGNVGAATSVLISTGTGIKWESTSVAALQGVQGTTGAQGTTGTQGTTGAQGTTGTQGIQGRQGTTGTQGVQGPGGLTTTNADTLDTLDSSQFLRSDAADTSTGEITFDAGLTLGASQVINHNTTSSRDKVRLWNSGTYALGMKSGYSFGALGGAGSEYAISFQMSNTDDRGFWWGDSSHTDAQGAMALTTIGELTVAKAIRVGFGESDNVTPTYDLEVNGSVAIGSTITIVPYNTLGTLSFEGSAGQLFSITNNLTSGSIFSVNDVSGIPSIDVDADGTIQLAPYNGRVTIGAGDVSNCLDITSCLFT